MLCIMWISSFSSTKLWIAKTMASKPKTAPKTATNRNAISLPLDVGTAASMLPPPVVRTGQACPVTWTRPSTVVPSPERETNASPCSALTTPDPEDLDRLLATFYLPQADRFGADPRRGRDRRRRRDDLASTRLRLEPLGGVDRVPPHPVLEPPPLPRFPPTPRAEPGRAVAPALGV